MIMEISFAASGRSATWKIYAQRIKACRATIGPGPMSAWGHSLRFERDLATSACPPIPDISLRRSKPTRQAHGLLLDRRSQHCAIVGELETTAATLRSVTTSTLQLRLGQHATNIRAKAKVLCE
jgi:hypothetical protein